MRLPLIEMLIDGALTSSSNGEAQPVVNPATEEVIAHVVMAAPEDLDRALDAASRCFESWKETTAETRAMLLSKAAHLTVERKHEIARILTEENGKPLSEAAGEIQFCADAIQWYAEEAKRAYGRVIPARSSSVRQLALREPVGPALGFAAWNFPAGNVTLKIAAALAAGCTIIVKPSDETPATAMAIAKCFVDAGLPAGALNVVHGEPDAVSRRLIASPIPKKLSLTGSTPVGKLLQKRAAETLKRCTLELGGHAPVLIFEDAKIGNAVSALVGAKFRNAGQVCTAPTRFFVHEDIKEQFVQAFVDAAARIQVGDGSSPEVQMGPLITERRLKAVEELVVDAVGQGAKLRLGGQRLERKGFFFAPTVLDDVPHSARIMREEPFGPIAPIAAFREFDEVLERANALPYGLAAFVFTESASIAARASAALNTGVVGINHTSVHEPETPFGGVNDSGYGTESGIEGLDAYLRTKMVTHKFL